MTMTTTTIRECSVWCEPEKGVHRFVDYNMYNDLYPLGVRPGDAFRVGELESRCESWEVTGYGDVSCLVPGVEVRAVTVVRALEAPLCVDPDFPYAYLWTVQITARLSPAGAQ